MNDLRSWLRKVPHPSKVRAVDAEGDEKVVRIGVSRSRWRDAEDALTSIGAVYLEALDNDDQVLRACKLDGGEATDAKPGKGGGTEADRLAELARIITASNDQAVARYEGIVKLAFEQHGALIGVLGERLQGMEKAWHKLIMSMPQDEQDDVTDMLAKAVMGKMMAGGMAKTKPPKAEPETKPPKESNGAA